MMSFNRCILLLFLAGLAMSSVSILTVVEADNLNFKQTLGFEIVIYNT